MDVLLLSHLCCCIDQKTKTLLEIVTTYFTDFTSEQIKQLALLKELYTEWNSKINVISRKDMDDFYGHHVLHSLTIASRFNFTKDMYIMDLGCGGGFPGIPLAIFFPEARFHLVDSINKKLKVVSAIAAEIGLTNITTQHARAEDITDRKFDVVVSRAVAPLKDLWHWSKPLLRRRKNEPRTIADVNGLICLKGGDLAQEISESGCKPQAWEIEKIYSEPFFKDKYLLYIPLK